MTIYIVESVDPDVVPFVESVWDSEEKAQAEIVRLIAEVGSHDMIYRIITRSLNEESVW